MHAIKFAALIVLGAITTLLFISTPAAAHTGAGDDGLVELRAATARYHDVAVAQAHGYALLKDAAGIACIANPPLGAMGIHYVNGAVVASGKLDEETPQAVVYEPEANGQLRMVAVEFIAFRAAWDAHHNAPPSLFGQQFMLTTTPNRFGLPAFYSLHVWIGKQNPSGMFSMWNPRVQCEASANAAA